MSKADYTKKTSNVCDTICEHSIPEISETSSDNDDLEIYDSDYEDNTTEDNTTYSLINKEQLEQITFELEMRN